MCLHPKKINRNGNYKETNYRGLKGEFYAISVYSKCGHCSQCMNEKSNNWVIRNYYESLTATKACFITLTYAENPKILIKKHLQDFLKRLRRHIEYHKINNNDKLRFFGNGEYGTLRGRPHFHIIVYNWEDYKENLKFGGFNKKGNPYFFSKTINETWKFGRTTYQFFEQHEIPYIALYECAKEEEKRDYIITKENTKKWLAELKEKNQNLVHRKILIKELETALKKQEKDKERYLTFKEFNTWSIALGFENWYNEYSKEIERNGKADFKVYIEDKEFLVPSPWVKKCANWGDIHATREMLLREQQLKSSLTEEEEETKNKILYAYKKKDNIIKFNKRKNNFEF